VSVEGQFSFFKAGSGIGTASILTRSIWSGIFEHKSRIPEIQMWGQKNVFPIPRLHTDFRKLFLSKRLCMGGKSRLHRKIVNSVTVIFTATGIIAASLVTISCYLDSDEVFFKSPYSKPIPGQSSAI
jgi:hypothetical protein